MLQRRRLAVPVYCAVVGLLLTFPIRAVAALHAGAVAPPDPPPAARSREALVDTYGKAVRHFAPRLSAPHARAIAESVVRHSGRHDVDARLLVAVLAAEDLAARVKTGKDGLRLGTRPADRAVEALAADLNGRIRSLQAPGRSEEGLIRRVLASRAASRVSRRELRAEEVEAYTKEALDLYRRLCGEGPEGPPDEPPR
jgi:hypothetical protein